MRWERPGKATLSKVAKVFGYSLFAALVFLASAAYTFPTEPLRVSLEEALRRRGIKASLQELQLTGLGSFSLRNITIDVSHTPATSVNQRHKVRLGNADVDVSLFSLLGGKISASVTVHRGSGTLGPVNLAWRGNAPMEVELSQVQDFRLDGLLRFEDFGLAGTITKGKGTMRFDPKKGLSDAVGSLDLGLRGVIVRKPRFKFKDLGRVHLTDVDLGEVELQVKVDKPLRIPSLKKRPIRRTTKTSVVNLARAEINGKDVRVVTVPSSYIAPIEGRPFLDSRLDVELAFSINEDFFTRETPEGTPNLFLRTLFTADPRWRAAQSGEYYGLLCSGTLRRPSCLPKKPAVRGKAFGKPSKKVQVEKKPTKKMERSPGPQPQARRQPPRRERAATPERPAREPLPRPVMQSGSGSSTEQASGLPIPPSDKVPRSDEKGGPPGSTQARPARLVVPPPRIRPTIIGRPRFRKIVAPTRVIPAEIAPSGEAVQQQAGEGSDEEAP